MAIKPAMLTQALLLAGICFQSVFAFNGTCGQDDDWSSCHFNSTLDPDVDPDNTTFFNTTQYNTTQYNIALSDIADSTSLLVGEERRKALIAHGVLLGLAFAFLFPLGAAMTHPRRLKGSSWFHAGWNTFAYILAFAGSVLALWILPIGGDEDNVSTMALKILLGYTEWQAHLYIGAAVLAGISVLLLWGASIHRCTLQTGSKHPHTSLHRWLLAIFLVLGVVNGGIGLHLSDNTLTGKITYGVIAGLSFLLWALIWAFTARTSRKWTEKEDVEPQQTVPSQAAPAPTVVTERVVRE